MLSLRFNDTSSAAASACPAAPCPENVSTHVSGVQAPVVIALPPLVQLLTSPWWCLSAAASVSAAMSSSRHDSETFHKPAIQALWHMQTSVGYSSGPALAFNQRGDLSMYTFLVNTRLNRTLRCSVCLWL